MHMKSHGILTLKFKPRPRATAPCQNQLTATGCCTVFFLLGKLYSWATVAFRRLAAGNKHQINPHTTRTCCFTACAFCFNSSANHSMSYGIVYRLLTSNNANCLHGSYSSTESATLSIIVHQRVEHTSVRLFSPEKHSIRVKNPWSSSTPTSLVYAL